MVSAIQQLRSELKAAKTPELSLARGSLDLIAIELNTSCPNITDAPPPSYDFPSLMPLLDVLASAFYVDPTLTIGLKLPPYLYAACFEDVVKTIASYSRPVPASTINPIAFITCTNTLGSSLLFTDQVDLGSTDLSPALPSPLGGLGGNSIHPIALGNVYTFAQLLLRHIDQAIRIITIFGVGGVTSGAAAGRMFRAGAKIVGCATLLGYNGVLGFQTIANELA